MIELTDWLRHELARRADQEAPQEACGLISWAAPSVSHPEGRAALWGAENAASDPEHGFEIDGDTLIAIVNQIEARDEDLAGVYHSHPSGVSAPSPEDVATAARWPGLTWVIVGRSECACMEGEPDRTPGCDDCRGAGATYNYWAGVLA